MTLAEEQSLPSKVHHGVHEVLKHFSPTHTCQGMGGCERELNIPACLILQDGHCCPHTRSPLRRQLFLWYFP